jgi:hypothetical protein
VLDFGIGIFGNVGEIFQTKKHQVSFPMLVDDDIGQFGGDGIILKSFCFNLFAFLYKNLPLRHQSRRQEEGKK